MESFLIKVQTQTGIYARQWQAHAIDSLRAGDNVLVKAGTGSGKSFIFEAMAMAKDNGVVLIVSPLKALMKKQVLTRMTSLTIVSSLDIPWVYSRYGEP
jgi:ATP-dependent helicase YprA (DUF1998 family)